MLVALGIFVINAMFSLAFAWIMAKVLAAVVRSIFKGLSIIASIIGS